MRLFGPSKSELEAQINELETKLECTKNDYDALNNRINNAWNEIQHLEDRLDGLVETLNHALSPNFGDGLDKVPDHEGEGVVEVIDETRIAYKATESAIVELYIPAGAKVVYPKGIHERKLRTDMAVVNAFYDPDDVGDYIHYKNDPRRGASYGSTMSDFDPVDAPTELEQCDNPVLEDNSKYTDDFSYRVGQVVTPDEDLNTDTQKSCESGIHFFRTLDDAMGWY